jgi:LPS O-antigen subunit length determinant protein (WzzB/FepE family)
VLLAFLSLNAIAVTILLISYSTWRTAQTRAAATARYRQLVESSESEFQTGNTETALNTVQKAIVVDSVVDKSDAKRLLGEIREKKTADANAELRRIVALARQEIAEERLDSAVDLLNRAVTLENATHKNDAIELRWTPKSGQVIKIQECGRSREDF